MIRMAVSLRPSAALPFFFALLATALSPAAKALSAYLAPSENFDLSHWKLTLPSGDEVDNVVLNSGYSYAHVFYTDLQTGGMVFRCPNLGGTTTNSNYSRTELRELLAPHDSNSKSDANNWTPEEGGWLSGKLRVDRVSTTGESSKLGRVIVGQIHGPETEPMRLYYVKKPYEKTGRIYAAMESVGNRTRYSTDIVSNVDGKGIALGESFSYQIKLAGTRLDVAIYRADGRKHTYTTSIDSAYLGLNLYFKAGVYNQNNTGDSSDYAQATFFVLRQRHPYPE